MTSEQLKYAGIVVAVAIVAFFGWKFFAGSDAETAINARLDELEAIALKDGKESTIESFGKAKKVSGFFVERPYIELLPGMQVVDDRDSLAGVLASMRGRADAFEVSFTNRKVDVADSGDSAFVMLFAKANGSGFGDNRSYSGKYRMNWVLEDDDWLITKVERVQE